MALHTALGPLYRVTREVRPVGGCRLFVALEEAGAAELLVKVLPAELSLGLDADTLERECILLADQLGHERLVPPRGSGRAGSYVYHTRAFVPGTTLRAQLNRGGELPLHVAVEVLRDLLAGLTHAHGRRVAHGDLKPENVLLTERQACVADTGIVDAVERAFRDGTGGTATVALCAVPYLAPERRDGGGQSVRDDVFAVGVLVYEMLTRALPGPDAEPLDEVRSVPSWLSELVRRCLAKDPAARWADAAAMLETVGPRFHA
jgi:serine/threonine-protein kinase